MDLENKNVLVTGAGSGIGIGFVRAFEKRGARLVLCDIDSTRLAAVYSQALNNNPRHIILTKDLSLASDRSALVAEIAEKKIEVDVLVNNAGIGYRSFLCDTSWEELQRIIDVNVVATAHLSWLFLPAMKRKNFGGIINVSSTGAFCGADLASVYTGTKAFVSNFTEGLSMELFGTGVRALAAHPGATNTNFWTASGWKNSNYSDWIRMMDPNDVAEEFVKAFTRGSSSVIAGTKNKLMVMISRLIPREILKQAAVRKYR